MTLKLRISFFLLASYVVLVLVPFFACADSTADLTVTPVVIDEKAKARDILKENVTISNTSQRKLILYPSVNNVKAQDGQQAFETAQNATDSQDSLANWIELSRGVIELAPGETREVPFVIRVNLNALPSTYHADISFYEGATRADAEAKNPLAVVTVNTEVQADIKESMQLNKFVTDGFFFSGDDVLFNYQLENIGNQELKPKGEIRIYDRKGREVASIPVNAEGKSLTPEQKAQLASAWSAAQGFGKFKAFLNIDYGNNQSGKLQDTVFFWIIPWQQLLAILIISIIAIIVSALYFHRWLEHKHMQRFAIAHAGGGAAILQAPMRTVLPASAVVAPAPVAVQKQSQITNVMPPVPHEEKRGWFSRFRRRKAESAAPTVQTPVPPVASAPVAVTSEPVIRENPQPAQPSVVPQRSQAIDLTGEAVHPTVARKVGAVINLKDGV